MEHSRLLHARDNFQSLPKVESAPTRAAEAGVATISTKAAESERLKKGSCCLGRAKRSRKGVDGLVAEARITKGEKKDAVAAACLYRSLRRLSTTSSLPRDRAIEGGQAGCQPHRCARAVIGKRKEIAATCSQSCAGDMRHRAILLMGQFRTSAMPPRGRFIFRESVSLRRSERKRSAKGSKSKTN